jgi:hypothetical protein
MDDVSSFNAFELYLRAARTGTSPAPKPMATARTADMITMRWSTPDAGQRIVDKRVVRRSVEPHQPTTTDAAPAAVASTMLSTMSCDASRQRDIPSASRTAIS